MCINFPCDNKIIKKVKVNQRTLNSFLENELCNVKKIDTLQINIEGGELKYLKCLKGLDLNKFKPSVILVENITDNIEIHDYLLNFGYFLDKKLLYNHFYLKNNSNPYIY